MKLGISLGLVVVLTLLLTAVSVGAAEPYAATSNIGPHVPEAVVVASAPFTEYGATSNLGPHVPEELIVSPTESAPFTEYGASPNLGPHVPEELIE